MTRQSGIYGSGQYGYALYGTRIQIRDINGRGHIRKIHSNNINSDAYIQKPGTEGSLTSDYFIKKLAAEKSITSDSYILDTNENTLDSDYYILKETPKTIKSDYTILKPGEEGSLTSDYFIKKLDNEETITSDSFILKAAENTINSDSFILKITDKDLISDSYILQTYSKTITSDAYITRHKRLPHGFQRSMWHDGTRYWRSYYDYDNSRIVFEYSADKENWTENTNARISANAFNTEWINDTLNWADYSIEFQGNEYIWVVYKSGNDIKVREASANEGYPSTFWSWGTEYTPLDGDTDGGEYLYANITKRVQSAGNFKLAASGTLHISTDYRVRVALATKNKKVTDWDSPVTISSETNTSKYTYNSVRETSTTADAFYAVWNEGTAIKGRYYNGSWQTTEEIGSLNQVVTTCYRCGWAIEHARDSAETLHIAYVDDLGVLEHKYNPDASVADNWTEDVQVTDDPDCLCYVTIAEGVTPGIMYIATGQQVGETRLVGIWRSGPDYTDWGVARQLGTEYAQALNILDESPENVGYTIQTDTEILTYFFHAVENLTSDMQIGWPGQTETINSDYFILATNSATITSDAKILKEGYEGSINSDYFIKKADNEEQISGLAVVIRKGVVNQINSDYFIKKLATEKTITSDAHILKLKENSLTSDSYILKTSAETIISDYSILAESTESITSDAYISKTYENSISSDSYILQTYESTLTSDAYLTGETGAGIPSDYFIKQTYSEAINSDSYLAYRIQKTIDSDSYIISSAAESIDSDSYILKTYEQSINSDYYIITSSSNTINSDVFIKKENTQTITSDAYLAYNILKTITSDAEIVKIGRGILISPENTTQVSSAEVYFTFYVPVYTLGNINIQIQVARDSGFNDIQVSDFSNSPAEGEWEYYDGSDWVSYPAAGLPYLMNQRARVKLSNLSGVKYWRIRGFII